MLNVILRDGKLIVAIHAPGSNSQCMIGYLIVQFEGPIDTRYLACFVGKRVVCCNEFPYGIHTRSLWSPVDYEDYEDRHWY